METTNGKIGKLIKSKRKEQKMTQEELAGEMNVSKNTISKWEKGGGIKIDNFCKLIDVLKFTPEDIKSLGTEDNIEQNENTFINSQTIKIKTEISTSNSLTEYNIHNKTQIEKYFLFFLLCTFLLVGTQSINIYEIIIKSTTSFMKWTTCVVFVLYLISGLIFINISFQKNKCKSTMN